MTAKAFQFWLDLIRFKRLANSDVEAARLLGISKNTMVKLKRVRADQRTALACEAILHGLKPFAREHAFLPGLETVND